LIVLSEAEAAHPASDPKLGSSVLASHIRLHTISLTPNAVLENLCQKSKGKFRLPTARDEVADCVEQAYLSLVGRYVIRYQMVSPGASTLTIKVQSRQGWGETRIPIPPETGFSQWSTES